MSGSAFSILIGLLSAAPSGIEVELLPINGTNRVLRDEAMVSFVVYRSVASGAVSAPLTEGQRIELRRPGGPWLSCLPGESSTPGNRSGPRERSEYRKTFVPGEVARSYLGRLENSCPGLAAQVGTFEVRIVEHWDGADVASSAQQVVIEEPTGIDAEAHEFRRRHEKEAGFAEQFIRRFPGTPYAGEYLIRRSPAAAPIAVSEQVTRIREGRSILGDRAHAPLVTAFVTRNPDHLLSPELRKVAFAAALVQGDRTTAQRLIGDMEQSGGEEVAVQEARLLLSRDSPEAC